LNRHQRVERSAGRRDANKATGDGHRIAPSTIVPSALQAPPNCAPPALDGSGAISRETLVARRTTWPCRAPSSARSAH